MITWIYIEKLAIVKESENTQCYELNNFFFQSARLLNLFCFHFILSYLGSIKFQFCRFLVYWKKKSQVVPSDRIKSWNIECKLCVSTLSPQKSRLQQKKVCKLTFITYCFKGILMVTFLSSWNVTQWHFFIRRTRKSEIRVRKLYTQFGYYNELILRIAYTTPKHWRIRTRLLFTTVKSWVKSMTSLGIPIELFRSARYPRNAITSLWIINNAWKY